MPSEDPAPGYLHDLATLDERRQVIATFLERYNDEWLLERHGDRTQPRSVERSPGMELAVPLREAPGW